MIRHIVTGAGGGPPELHGGGIGRICVVSKSKYQFNGASGATEEIPLAEYVEAVGCVSAVLEVRCHAKTMGTGQQFTVNVYNTSYDPQNPSASFAEPSTRAYVTIAPSDSSPQLYTAAFSTPIAGLVRVTLKATQATSAASMDCTISVDIIARAA
ncbi:MAG: hypothetical protein HY744_17270 [Deltaproteobacteria bacterium]|nr:hypothetical protein [Deltaproteobacteria bacterium]